MANTLTKALATPTLHPQVEYNLMKKVAQEYKLNDDQMALLVAIRNQENGSQGREFGVLNKQAMRFAKDPDLTKSFYTQAQWAAGTIKKRYNGNLEEFAKRYAPLKATNDPTGLNKNWLKGVQTFMQLYKEVGNE